MTIFRQYSVRGVAGSGELAALLTRYSPLSLGGERVITEADIHTWREHASMPAPLPDRPETEPVWDQVAVLLWFLSWRDPRVTHAPCRAVRRPRPGRCCRQWPWLHFTCGGA